MKKTALILLLVCLAGIAYADISPVADVMAMGLAIIVVLLVSWAMTIGVELVTSFVYLHVKKLSKQVLLSIIVANIISVPLLWGFVIAVSLLSPSMTTYMVALLTGEVGVVVLEAVVIFLMNKKRIEKSDAIAMSIINNLASFLVGAALVLITRL